MDLAQTSPPALMRSAHQEILLYSHSVRDKALAMSLARARKEQGVKVYVLIDSDSTFDPGSYHMWMLGQGINVYRVRGSGFNRDFAVVDRRYLIEGDALGDPTLPGNTPVRIQDSPTNLPGLYNQTLELLKRPITLKQALEALRSPK